jgi:hypothetical protein
MTLKRYIPYLNERDSPHFSEIRLEIFHLYICTTDKEIKTEKGASLYVNEVESLEVY